MIPLKRNKDLAVPNPINKLAFTPIWNHMKYSIFLLHFSKSTGTHPKEYVDKWTEYYMPISKVWAFSWKKSGSSISVCESTWTASSGYSLPSASCCLLKEELKETAGGSIKCDSACCCLVRGSRRRPRWGSTNGQGFT